MAYDENGNYYFDPNDYEDQQAFQEEAQREKVREIVRKQQQIAKDHNDLNKLWMETLSDAGLDNQTYEKLYQEDKELAQGLMREGMKNLAHGMKKGRDKKTGRFVKADTAGQPGSQESQQRISDLKAKVAKGEVLSGSDEEAVIDNIIGKLF